MTSKSAIEDAIEELNEATDNVPPLSAVLRGEVEINSEDEGT